MDVADRAEWKREAAHAAGTVSQIVSRLGGQAAGSRVARPTVRGVRRCRRTAPARPADAPQAQRVGLSEPELAARHLDLALRAFGADAGAGCGWW